MSLTQYMVMDFWRNFRNFANTFFVILLPVMLFLFFGVNMEWSDQPVGQGNVSAWTMIAMGAYGATIATTSLAGSAAVEMQQGWGRQLNLTSMTHSMFIIAKSVIALAMAVLPVAVLNIIGVFSVTDMPLGVWLATAGLTIVGAVPFALYGLAIGLAFRSDAATGAASGLLVVFGFLGNAFVPLEGLLLEIGRFTPLYGTVALARYPLTEGHAVTMDGELIADPLWAVLVNIIAWTVLFATACVLLQRRRTVRR